MDAAEKRKKKRWRRRKEMMLGAGKSFSLWVLEQEKRLLGKKDCNWRYAAALLFCCWKEVNKCSHNTSPLLEHTTLCKKESREYVATPLQLCFQVSWCLFSNWEPQQHMGSPLELFFLLLMSIVIIDSRWALTFLIPSLHGQDFHMSFPRLRNKEK